MKHLLRLFLIVFCLPSCKQKDTSILEKEMMQEYDVAYRAFADKYKQYDTAKKVSCDIAYTKIGDLGTLNTPFKKRVMEQLLPKEGEGLSENQKFVNALLRYEKDYNNPSPIHPIVNSNREAIILYPKNGGYTYHLPLYDEHFLQEYTLLNPEKKKATFFKEASTIDSIFRQSSKVYIYSDQKRYTGRQLFLRDYPDNCNGMGLYGYVINDSTVQPTEKILLSSPYKLDLDYINDPTIDHFFDRYRVDSTCWDCPSSIGYTKTFARLKGLEHLYFVYADEPHQALDDIASPIRGLIYSNGKFVFLVWEYEQEFCCEWL